VILDQAGHILTVSYIILDAHEIEVSLRDGRTLPATLTGIDLESGLGVIRLEGPGPWPTAVLGSSAGARVGDGAAIVGISEANRTVVSYGTIRAIQSFAGYWEYFLERALLVAPTNPAFGGSPLVNIHGEVIGVTSLRLGDPPQVNLAVPIELFQSVKDELLVKGEISRPPRPWLGVSALPVDNGIVVARVGPIGPARQAGLRAGDVIVRLNGEPVGGLEDFYRKLWRTTVGSEVTLTILRDARPEVITVRPADRYQFYRTRGR
jgi:S1-C subfamily serine protease